ncbi:helix-turn-helix domain-containing protein [Paraburkholderia sediminicola]|uniref:helix-turn-helix domain-containing protein n=1 Tax=Paraburkholderia sediminicola TaxID=458836 RepID=UPI0038B6CEA2
MTALGDLVRASRLAQGLTRDDVAIATGLSPKFITHIEAGKPTAQIGKVLHLLGELGITLRAQVSVDIPPALATKALHRRRTTHGR